MQFGEAYGPNAGISTVALQSCLYIDPSRSLGLTSDNAGVTARVSDENCHTYTARGEQGPCGMG